MQKDTQKTEQTTMQTTIPDEARARLEAILEGFEATAQTQIGYPVNQDHDYSDLLPILQYSANNIGDPYQGSNYRTNTHDIEREVIAYFADLMRLEQEQAWGYVTSGGTEGNMYGLYMGRETFPDGTVYFSQDTHYSVVKLLRLLNIRNVMIRSGDNGEIDYEDLRETLSVNRGVPAIIVANIGTTMKGAVDDLDRIRETLDDLEIEDRYIHADAALSGMILPFVQDPQPHGFDAGVDSMSVSGHKLIGSPLPCGIVLTRRDYVARIARSVELVGVLDTTIPGSRSAVAPMIIWYALQKHGAEGFRRMVAGMMETAEYAVQRFQDGGIPAWRNRNSAIVVLPRPGEEVFRKWQIAPSEDIAHIVTMPHVTRETVDELVDDCLRHRRD